MKIFKKKKKQYLKKENHQQEIQQYNNNNIEEEKHQGYIQLSGVQLDNGNGNGNGNGNIVIKKDNDNDNNYDDEIKNIFTSMYSTAIKKYLEDLNSEINDNFKYNIQYTKVYIF